MRRVGSSPGRGGGAVQCRRGGLRRGQFERGRHRFRGQDVGGCAADHQPQVRNGVPEGGQQPFRGHDGRHFSGEDHQGDRGAAQYFFRSGVEGPGQVDDQHLASPGSGVEHGAHGLRGNRGVRAVPGPGHHGKTVDVGQRVAECWPEHASLSVAELLPAGSGHVLGTQQDVESSAERIGVDQCGAQSGTVSGERECRGEQACPAPPRPPITGRPGFFPGMVGGFGERHQLLFCIG